MSNNTDRDELVAIILIKTFLPKRTNEKKILFFFLHLRSYGFNQIWVFKHDYHVHKIARGVN